MQLRYSCNKIYFRTFLLDGEHVISDIVIDV